MKRPGRVFLLLLALSQPLAVLAGEVIPGRNLDGLLEYARGNNPDYSAMRYEAEAADERAMAAGALPDRKLRTELMNITRSGDQNATLSPSRVGSTKYTVLQELPWYGKRDLQRKIAESDAASVQGQVRATWSELSTRIKSTFARLYFVQNNERLLREILVLMQRLEKVAQVRYENGLAPQQDVIRAQVEQTAMRNELIALDNERGRLSATTNALLARPAQAALAGAEVLRPLPSPAALDYSGLEERVRLRNPQLFVEDAKIKSAENSRDLTYRNRYPDFMVGVSPTQVQNDVKEWAIMFEVNIPLQQASRRWKERASESMLSAARMRKAATENQVLGDLSANLTGIDAARRTERLIETSLLP